LVTGVLPLLRHKAELQGVELRFTPPADAVPVIGHVGSLKHAFMSVVMNGLEGRTAGGIITVRVDRDGTEGILSVVEDGGETPGGPLERMAEPRSPDGGAGGGLGLAAAREVLAAHGGRIALQTQPGKGRRIDLILPLN